MNYVTSSTLVYSLHILYTLPMHVIYIYIKLSVCLSICPSKIQWRPTFFSRPEGRVQAIFAPNEALIIQESNTFI